MNTTLSFQVQQLLAYTKISIDKEELSFQIESHPSYPSLHAVTGVLDHFSIDNVALDVPINAAIIDQLPPTYLAQVLLEGEKNFAVIHKVKNRYKIVYSKSKNDLVLKEQLLEKLTGIIVAVERTDDEEKAKISKKLIPDNVLLVLLGVVLVGLVLVSKPVWGSVPYLLLAITGLLISISIVKQQFGLQSQLGDAFCSGASTTKDCNAVLTSEGATIYKGLKLSDASVIFFSALSVLSLLTVLNVLSLSPLFVISFLTLPVVIYSIYYQYAFAKAWCPLCLLISGVLVLQAILSGVFLGLGEIVLISTIEVLTVISIFLVSYVAWNVLGAQIATLKSLKKVKLDHFKFKRNFDLFTMVLEKSPTTHTGIPTASEMIFGNRDAALSIVVVTSPFCGHCKPVHNMLSKVLHVYGDQVAVIIRFNVSIDQKDSPMYKISTRLLEIYHASGAEQCLEALHDIYGDLDLEAWLAKWESCKRPDLYESVLDQQEKWITANGIHFTPEILINGKSYPKEYDRQELPFFIEDLAEQCQNHTVQVAPVLQKN